MVFAPYGANTTLPRRTHPAGQFSARRTAGQQRVPRVVGIDAQKARAEAAGVHAAEFALEVGRADVPAPHEPHLPLRVIQQFAERLSDPGVAPQVERFG
ncbi:hypothetical protein QOL99_02300 [Deinococcus sp. MIMF12]|uniref:Uncharacterized protein n=1 Tax=Deinococcus rhizophilus TaxID=3049544 RepID=A0ABT7JD56_9DEIO|nr:hypothetical protein [Deinococcus rhizophilus]MDL2342975.1 hypothetical protein [Deinococcus rhizophilus]